MAEIIPLRSAEIIDRHDVNFWRTPSEKICSCRTNFCDYPNNCVDDKLRLYERLLGGDDDGSAA